MAYYRCLIVRFTEDFHSTSLRLTARCTITEGMEVIFKFNITSMLRVKVKMYFFFSYSVKTIHTMVINIISFSYFEKKYRCKIFRKDKHCSNIRRKQRRSRKYQGDIQNVMCMWKTNWGTPRWQKDTPHKTRHTNL